MSTNFCFRRTFLFQATWPKTKWTAMSWSTAWVFVIFTSANYKFIDPKSLRSINGKGLNGWPQTFAKRSVKVETFEHIQDVEFSKLRPGQDMGRKIENFDKIRRENVFDQSECWWVINIGTGLNNLKLVPLSHSDFNGSHWFS